MIKKVEVKQTLPVSLLDELRSEEIKKRINSVSQLKTIATALGPDRTRNELVPFLNGIGLNDIEFVDDDEQVLVLLINTLKDFGAMIGGDHHEKCLIPLLISFCRSDEKTASEAATEAMISIMRRMDLKKSEDFIIETIRKMVESDSMRGKESGISLLATMIRQLNQAPLLDTYVLFAGDSNFQMRKIATKYLKTVVTNVRDNHPIVSKLILNLLNDREDLIKMMALEGAIKYFPENPTIVLDSIRNMLTLNSWRINMKICEELPALLQQTTKQQFKTYIQQTYMRFLTHDEPELRAAACPCLEAVCQSMEASDIVKLIVPAIQKLSMDAKPFVRGNIQYNSVEVAKEFLLLSQFIPKQLTIDMLLPLMAGFLKDPDPNTSLAVFSSLPILFNSIPAQQLEETALQCINQLFSSNNWRTKCRAIEIMGQFMKFPTFLNEKIVNIIVGWTSDKIDAVRMKAISLLQILIKSWDTMTLESKLIPKLTAMQNCPSYLQRQLILHIIDRTVKHVSSQLLSNSYLPVMMALSKDRVPNIRYMIVKIVKNNPILLSNVRFKSLIDSLIEDKDIEVKQQAKSIAV